MPHAGLARAIEKHLALPQHVHRVASGQKYALDAGQRRCQRLFPIKIELDGADTQFSKGAALAGERTAATGSISAWDCKDAGSHRLSGRWRR